MGGWEVLIALFGGAWYVVSAIAAAKEKKKKQAERRAALKDESTSLDAHTQPSDTPAVSEVSLREKSDILTKLNPERSKEVSPRDVSLKAGVEDASRMRQARKAILESMRKELGLPPSKPSAQKPPPKPSARPIPTPSAQPIPRPAPVQQPTGLVVPMQPTPPPAGFQRPNRVLERSAQRPRPPRRRQTQKKARASGELTAESLQTLLQRPSGLKQAIVMAEILQPPVSLRNQHLAT
ncbi:MAG: hypothetical protein VX527_05875 [Planctomycetota bacterium]|nr:hypothetical protein [Planctomycetota bacterium]